MSTIRVPGVKPKYYGADDPTPNNIMNNLGDKLWSVDADNIQYEFVSGEPKTACIIDFKHFRTECISFSDPRSKSKTGMKYLRQLANREKVPFLIVIAFVKPEDGFGPAFVGQTYEVSKIVDGVIEKVKELVPNGKAPMFYVLPGNFAAAKLLCKNKKKQHYTPREFKQLMGQARVQYGPARSDHLSNEYVEYNIQTDIDVDDLRRNCAPEGATIHPIKKSANSGPVKTSQVL